LGDIFGRFVEEIVGSDIVGEEQDNLEQDLLYLGRILFGVTLLGKSRTIWRNIW
jgi:hypothetical protein